ncbi:hypothetical protein GCM10010400_02810 [Streptomyces aculeolatus]
MTDPDTGGTPGNVHVMRTIRSPEGTTVRRHRPGTTPHRSPRFAAGLGVALLLAAAAGAAPPVPQ